MLLSPPGDRQAAVRRSLALVRFTLAYNLVELVVAMWAGLAAGSAALVGFGLDSAVESSASVILLWRLGRESDEECAQDDDRLAQRLIAGSFGLLAVWVVQESVRQLIAGAQPDVSVVGIVLATTSVIVMPFLAREKMGVAPALGSRAAEAEGGQTMLCAYLSAALLIGLGANALFSWWWADPLAGLVIGAFAAREGWQTWRAESLADTCCT